jgi:hypothetical protein
MDVSDVHVKSPVECVKIEWIYRSFVRFLSVSFVRFIPFRTSFRADGLSFCLFSAFPVIFPRTVFLDGHSRL